MRTSRGFRARFSTNTTGVLPCATGRPLLEALAQNGASVADYTTVPGTISSPAPALGLVMRLPTDPGGADIDASATTFDTEVSVKDVSIGGGAPFRYFDRARAVRQ